MSDLMMGLPAEPLYFGEPACFGWLHRADPGQQLAGLPVLICGPVGAEDLSAHRSLRLLAEGLAQQGQTCLRFDLPGQGDAAPLDAEANALPIWFAALHGAIDTLRAATGAPQVALIGLRLGATLAALAAQGRNDVAAFAAWVPVVSGRSMLREWKMLGAGGLPSLTHADGSLESGGFCYSAATCAALSKLSLLAPLAQPLKQPAAQMLVLDRADLPVARPWLDALRQQGVHVVDDLLPGYEGLLAVPHLVQLPEQMLARLLGWMRALPPADLAAGEHQLVNVSASAGANAITAVGAPSARWLVGGRAVVARPVWLGGSANEPVHGSAHEPALFAIRCEAAGPVLREKALPRTAILMLNTGAERRIGPHGQFVTLARQWAGAGALVLRLDLAGLGDSAAAPGAPAQQVYAPAAMADVRRAVAYLRAQPGVQRVVVLGLCSGAFHAFEALASGVAVDQVVAINPLLFFRPENQDFDAVPLQDHAVQQLSGEAMKNLRDPARWAKLLRGEADLAFIAATLRRRLGLSLRRLLRGAARTLGRPLADDLAAKLAKALQGGPVQPRLCLVFAEQDPGLALLRAGAGRHLGRWLRAGQLRIVTVPEADHTFSRADARARLRAVLAEVLGPLAPGDIANNTANNTTHTTTDTAGRGAGQSLTDTEPRQAAR